MKAKQKELPLIEAVRNEFLNVASNGNDKIYKEELVKRLRGHKRLYKKDYKRAISSIVGCAWYVTEDLLREEPPILITPFPIHNRSYDGWQVTTKKSKMSSLLEEIRIEKYQKLFRRLNNLFAKIEREKEADKKLKILDTRKIKKIERKEIKKTILLSDSRR